MYIRYRGGGKGGRAEAGAGEAPARSELGYSRGGRYSIVIVIIIIIIIFIIIIIIISIIIVAGIQ